MKIKTRAQLADLFPPRISDAVDACLESDRVQQVGPQKKV